MDSLQYLFSLEHLGIKFGLENMRAIVEALGHPERAFRSIHVAGTNGKGSVTSIVDAALRAGGRRSARYTSPHLLSIRERFVIDGQPVTHEQLIDAIQHVRLHIDRLLDAGTLQVQPTFFEVTTAIAFELFRRAQVDTAVIEVGLGGRLDATNVLSPVLTAITSIAFDHEQLLGRTLGEIAREKAGIIKTGVPVVVGRLPRDADTEIEAIARSRGAGLIRAWDGVTAVLDPSDETFTLRTSERDYGRVTPALRGAHQVANAVVAVRILERLSTVGIEVGAKEIVEGMTRTSWPGRLDLRQLPDGREVLLDAAHNPAGTAALAAYLTASGRNEWPLVFAAMRDKDAAAMFDALLPAVGSVVLTRASTDRSADPETLADRARTARPDIRVDVASSVVEALAAAFARSPRVVVAGSIFLLADVMRALDLPWL